MRLLGILTLALLASLVEPARAQTKEEAVTNLVLGVAESIDQAREAKQKREAERLEQQNERWAKEIRDREARDKADEKRRQALAGQVKQWPGLGSLRPPLEPGDIFAETQNGCGIVISARGVQALQRIKQDANGKNVTGADGKLAMEAVSPELFIRDSVWTGDCPYGLAHGLGTLSRRADLALIIDMKQEYAYGRILSRTLRPQEIHYRGSGQRHVSIPSWKDPFVPRFGEIGTADSTTLSIMSFANGSEMTFVRALTKDCTIVTGKKPRGCSWENNFKAYLVSVLAIQDGKPPQSVETLCPDPRSAAKCEGLWQQIAGPIIEQIKPIVAQAEAQDAARKAELEKMHAMHVLNFRVNEMARQAQAKQQVERRQAVVRATEEQLRNEHEASAAAERAAQEKAEREFQAKLTTLNPGQLYVMADELKVAGKSTQARAALRAIVERFPNHALAATAAATLSTLR